MSEANEAVDKLFIVLKGGRSRKDNVQVDYLEEDGGKKSGLVLQRVCTIYGLSAQPQLYQEAVVGKICNKC